MNALDVSHNIFIRLNYSADYHCSILNMVKNEPKMTVKNYKLDICSFEGQHSTNGLLKITSLIVK